MNEKFSIWDKERQSDDSDYYEDEDEFEDPRANWKMETELAMTDNYNRRLMQAGVRLKVEPPLKRKQRKSYAPKYVFSNLLRLVARNLLIALSLIWRTRSRVRPNLSPISSSESGCSTPIPKYSLITSA